MACASIACVSGEDKLRRALRQTSGVVHLPAGVIEVSSEIEIPIGAHDLEVVGSQGTLLRAAKNFHGRAIVSCWSGQRIRIHDFAIDGSRAAIARPFDMAPPENAFRIFYPNNGLVFDRVSGLEISNVRFEEISNFAILVSRSTAVNIHHILIENSGSRGIRGRNNSTGGVVIEEGSTDFQVTHSTLPEHPRQRRLDPFALHLAAQRRWPDRSEPL